MSFNSQESVAQELALIAEIDQICRVSELMLLSNNDYQLYSSRVEPITKNLDRKRAKGIFKQELAEKLVKYLMDDVAKKYAKHYDYKFTPDDRRMASKLWVREYLER